MARNFLNVGIIGLDLEQVIFIMSRQKISGEPVLETRPTNLILEIPCYVGNRHSRCGALDFDRDPRYCVDYVSDGCLSSFCRIYGSQCSQFAQYFHRFSSWEKMNKCFLDLLSNRGKWGDVSTFVIGKHVLSKRFFFVNNKPKNKLRLQQWQLFYSKNCNSLP